MFGGGVVLSILKNYWREIFIVLVLGYVVIKWNYMESSITTLKQTNIELKQSNDALVKSNDRLVDSFDTVNKSLTIIAGKSDEVKAAFERLRGSVNVQTTTVNKKLDKVLVEKKPENSDEAMKYLLDARKEYKEPKK